MKPKRDMRTGTAQTTDGGGNEDNKLIIIRRIMSWECGV